MDIFRPDNLWSLSFNYGGIPPQEEFIMTKFFAMAALTLFTFSALAGDASNVKWSCIQTTGYTVTIVNIENGQATVSSYSRINGMQPMVVGGPFTNLETYGGGDYIGVRTVDSAGFSLIAGNLEYRSRFGGTIRVDGVTCR
jgi:hypothetical protein